MASTDAPAAEETELAPAAVRRDLRRLGGVSALLEALIYAAAIVYFLLVLDYASVTDPDQAVALLVANQASMHAMNFLAYVVFGLLLVVLALALHEHLRTGAPVLMRTATAVGLIWAGLVIASGMIANVGAAAVVDLYATDPAAATALWMAIDPVVEGLGGGNEIVGGVWTLLVSVAAMRAGLLHRAVNALGVVVGAAGVVSAIPALADVGGGVFGLAGLVWFAAVGLLLLRGHRTEAA